MSAANVTNIAIGVLIVGWLVVRQLRPRPVRETTAARLVVILGIIGVVETVQAAKGHRVDATAVTWIVASLVLGAVLGSTRALSVRIWRDASGVAWRQGTWVTGVLWAVSLGAHLLIDVEIDDATTAKSLGPATLLLYLAVTLGVQRELMRWRSAQIGGAAAPEYP
jgi:NAD/NADP transhydrogenase beta subunit